MVAHRRPLTSALAWLAVVFFQPWIGAILFFLVETRAVRKVRRHAELVERSRSVDRTALQDAHRVASPLAGGDDLAALSARLGGFGLLGGNGVRVLGRHRAALDALLRDVASARRHVHALYFTVRDDDTGRAFAEALVEAAARGIRCRLLLDAVGSAGFLRSRAPWLQERGVDIVRMFPVNPLRARLGPVDVRNHRKLVLVDGRIAHTGSMNLTDPVGTGGPEPEPWRDLSFRIEGPAVLQLQLVFMEDWSYHAGGSLAREGLFPTPVHAGSEAVQVVPSGPRDTARTRAFHRLVVAALHRASRRIVVTTPYLIPDEATETALAVAAARGVRVDVLVPRRSDSRFVTLASQAHYQELLDGGVRVLEHDRGFLHAKAITVDGELALIGSANFDRRSFHLNFELTLLLHGPGAARAVAGIQDGYLEEARALDPERWRARSFGRRVVEDVARLASPLL